MAQILILYNATQTYTQTALEHLEAFAQFSEHTYHFTHISETLSCTVDLSTYDGLALHYSVRLPSNQISPSWVNAIETFPGFKALFIQDEYEHTKRAWYWIKKLKLTTVFTCVPSLNIEKIYPPEHFGSVQFVNVLTGYVPHSLEMLTPPPPPSEREILVGHRGRALPTRYGRLGQEKLEIGTMVKAYAKTHGHPVDIEWREEKRIYGEKWYSFVASARATLGTESGANVFDWNGDLSARITAAQAAHPTLSDAQVLDHLGVDDQDGLMNQISPRVFEAIALRTALVLFRGSYSGLLQPDRHYIALEKDGSNLTEVFEHLQNGAALDAMTERAYVDVITSGVASYKAFLAIVDAATPLPLGPTSAPQSPNVTARPLQGAIPIQSFADLVRAIISPQKRAEGQASSRLVPILGYAGRLLPETARHKLSPAIKRAFKT